MGLGVKRAAAVVDVADSEEADPLSPSVEAIAGGESRTPHIPPGRARFLPEVRAFLGKDAVSSLAVVEEKVAGVVIAVGAFVIEVSFLDLFFEGFAVTGSGTGSESGTDTGSSSEAVSGAAVTVIVAVVID